MLVLGVDFGCWLWVLSLGCRHYILLVDVGMDVGIGRGHGLWAWAWGVNIKLRHV